MRGKGHKKNSTPWGSLALEMAMPALVEASSVEAGDYQIFAHVE